VAHVATNARSTAAASAISASTARPRLLAFAPGAARAISPTTARPRLLGFAADSSAARAPAPRHGRCDRCDRRGAGPGRRDVDSSLMAARES
jgi:hypothetical protein